LTVVAVLFLALGGGLFLWALYQSIAMAAGSIAAAMVTGLGCLLVAGGLAWGARRLTN
jgi:hypothetical protein